MSRHRGGVHAAHRAEPLTARGPQRRAGPPSRLPIDLIDLMDGAGSAGSAGEADPAAGLLHVTVAAGPRRADVVVPGAVAVAELVPGLARRVGLLDTATVHGGYRLVTTEGRPLVPEAGLVDQGVPDGALLTMAAGVDDEPPRVYDDVVEAMADVIEHDLAPWSPHASRRTTSGAAGLLLALGAYALWLPGGSHLSAVVSGAGATLLVAAAVVLARGWGEIEAAVVCSWAAAVYAGVAGLRALPADSGLDLRLVAAGGSVLVAGLAALLGLGASRPLVLPAALAGALVALGGLLLVATGGEASVVLVGGLVVLVVLDGALPGPVLSLGRTRVEPARPVADHAGDPTPVERDRVSADARVAHRRLAAVTATLGLLLALAAPLAVTRGLGGTLLALACASVLMLRTRHMRAAGAVRLGLVSGAAGVASVTLSVLLLQPGWRATAAVVLAAVGTLLVVVLTLPGPPSVRRARWGDLAEAVCLPALAPLAVWGLGLVAAVRG